MAMLSPEQALIYKDARQSVLEKHAGLLNAKEDKKEKGAADDDAEKERKLAEIEARRKGLETDKETLKERRKELEGRLREEQAAFNKADAPLADQQNRLESQGLSIQRSLGNMQADMASLEATMAAEKDRTRLALLQIELGRITRIYRNLDADLFAIRRADQGIISKRQSLAAQAARSQQDLGGQLAGIDKQTLGLNGEAKRLENTERQTLKGGPGVKTHAMSLTASALNTYEPFPLDQEKLRLLALLK